MYIIRYISTDFTINDHNPSKWCTYVTSSFQKKISFINDTYTNIVILVLSLLKTLFPVDGVCFRLLIIELTPFVIKHETKYDISTQHDKKITTAIDVFFIIAICFQSMTLLYYNSVDSQRIENLEESK